MSEDGNNDMDINSPEENNDQQDVTSTAVMDQDFDHTPCQVDKHLDFLAVNKDGRLLMGSSNLTGRYWGGSLWYYHDASLAPSVEKCLVGYEINSGLADGAFLDNEKTIIVGQDSGTVEFFEIFMGEDGTKMKSICQMEEQHLDSISCVKVTCNQRTAITASLDKSIIVWDAKNSAIVRLLSTAHSQSVTGLAPHPSNDQIFLSTGMDGNVLLWDLRCPKPACCIYRDWEDKPECVSWSGEEGDLFIVGTQSGTLALRNKNVITHNLSSLQALRRPFYRFATNPKRQGRIAACGNDSKVVVVDVEAEEIKICYEDDRHNDFVRGLAWNDEHSLVTCGWDKRVYVHQIEK